MLAAGHHMHLNLESQTPETPLLLKLYSSHIRRRSETLQGMVTYLKLP